MSKENKKVVVYSKKGCGGCMFTKKKLDSLNVSYEERNLSENPEYAGEVEALGFQSLPVVVIDGEEPFNGYQVDHLEKIFAD